MKKSILLTALLSSALLLQTGMAFAGTKTKHVNQRQKNQQVRIVKGIQSGELTNKEVRKLERQQIRIQKAKKHAKSDGKVTKKERIRLKHMQNKASKNISRKKHNRQKR